MDMPIVCVACQSLQCVSALWCSLCVGGPNIVLARHGERQATAQPVDLAAGGNIVPGCEADPLIRVHGKWRSESRQMCTSDNTQYVVGEVGASRLALA